MPTGGKLVDGSDSSSSALKPFSSSLFGKVQQNLVGKAEMDKSVYRRVDLKLRDSHRQNRESIRPTRILDELEKPSREGMMSFSRRESESWRIGVGLSQETGVMPGEEMRWRGGHGMGRGDLTLLSLGLRHQGLEHQNWFEMKTEKMI